MRDMLLMRGLEGNAAIRGFSMLRPFWERTMAVCDGVTAGAIISATLGGDSGIIFVVTIMKSNGSRPSAATSGIVLRTIDGV